MRKLGDIFALMIFIPGMIFVAAGCMGGGSFSFWLGVAMMLGGGLLGRVASSERCPACRERLKAGALKCAYCGIALVAFWRD